MNEDVYEHRLRSFLANKPTGEAIFADIVHDYNETRKISIDYFYNLTTSLQVFSLPIPWGFGVFCNPIRGRVGSIFSRENVRSNIFFRELSRNIFTHVFLMSRVLFRTTLSFEPSCLWISHQPSQMRCSTTDNMGWTVPNFLVPSTRAQLKSFANFKK